MPTLLVVIPTVTPVPALASATSAPTITLAPAASASPKPTLTITPTLEAAQLTITVGANVRGGPSTLYPSLGGLEAGTKVAVIGRDASAQWYVINFAGAKDGRGWVSNLVATFAGDANSLPVLTAPPPPPTAIPPTPPPTPKPIAGAHGLTGELTLCSGKTAYAVGERICFNEKIYNSTSAFISYGVLGVLAVGTNGVNQFQTSWSGALGIDPGCYGPTDKCGGRWEDGLSLQAPGAYTLYLQICYSSLSACQGGGDWESLTGGLAVTVN